MEGEGILGKRVAVDDGYGAIEGDAVGKRRPDLGGEEAVVSGKGGANDSYGIFGGDFVSAKESQDWE